MVLAVRLERDVPQEHDLVIAADLFEGAAEVDRGILGIALGIFLPRTGDAARRVEQALAVRVVAGPADERSDGLGDILRNRAGRRRLDQIAIVGIAVIVAHVASSRSISSATAAACSRMSGTAMISQ